MKHIKIFKDFVREAQHEYDFVGIQAEMHGLSREEYTAYYLSEATAISSQNKPFKVKGIRFTYTEQRGRFYGAYLYDVAQTSNTQHKAKLSLEEVNIFLKSFKIKDEVPSSYERKELDSLCKQIAKKGIVCDHDDAMDIS
jgi:hypothetical protein